jgi:HPt (histidine-containing phosphotransfer) domain-containing protein
MEFEQETTKASPPKQRSQAMMTLTRRYLADLPLQLAAMRDAWLSGDMTGLQQQAHRAKGTSATYRLDRLAAQFSRLEELARSESPPELTPLLDQLAALVSEADHALAQDGERHV